MKNKKGSKYQNVLGLVTAGITAAAVLGGTNVHAAAKAPPAPATCGGGNGNYTTPNPTRKVVVQQIGTKAFQLPNGSTVDFSADLQTMLSTVVSGSTSFSPADPGNVDPCNNHLEIRAAVTNFQLNVASMGVQFGYTPSGEIPTSVNVTANATVQIGTIALDFSVWNCVAGSCSSVAASTASQATAGVKLTAEIDFGQIKTGPSLVYNTPLGDVIRAIMANGITQLSASNRLSELPWQASVREYVAASGTVFFDAGTQSRIGMNQTFEIYAPTNASSTGVCNVFETTAYIHTIAVNTVSSTAMVDQKIGSTDIKPGDIVMIRAAK